MKLVSALCVFTLLVICFFSCSDNNEKPKTIPTVTTGAATNVTSTSATVSGEITHDGNSKINITGFVYSDVNASPTINDTEIRVDVETDILNATLEDLEPETTYFVRAYAINNKGIGYGTVVSFTTLGPTTEGLLAYYDFNGNSQDQVGTNHGTNTNVTYTFIDDEHEEAVRFSGADSFVDLPDDFDFEDKTIALSFLAETITSTRSVLYGSDHANTQFGLTVISLIDDGAKRLNLNVSNEVTAIPIVENTWYNVIVVTDSKSYRYYFNGALVGSGTFPTYIHSGNGDELATIGRARVPLLFLDGLIDNLRIYNRALTEEEVEILAEF